MSFGKWTEVEPKNIGGGGDLDSPRKEATEGVNVRLVIHTTASNNLSIGLHSRLTY